MAGTANAARRGASAVVHGRVGSDNAGMPTIRRLLFPLFLAGWLAGGAAAHAAAPRIALLTVLDGDAQVLRDDGKYAAAEGLALQAGDILATGPQTRLLRVEYPDGHAVAFGPDTQALLEPHLSGDAANASVYLLSGWAKMNAAKAQAAALAGPALDVASSGGAAVVSWPTAAASGPAMIFAESGALQLQARGGMGAPATLAAGQMLTLAAGGTKPELSQRPTPAFVQAMPRAFMDSLPSRAAAFQGKDVAPKRLGALAYADVQPWIDAEPALRKAFVKRWRALAHDTDFRRGLVAGLKAHPEWEPVLYPPAQVPKAAAKN